jgi:hypothetical protein
MQTAAAERMRRMRARRAGHAGTGPLIFECDDWRLLIEGRTWPQKAGCQPGQVGRVVIKEIVENSLDSGGESVTLAGDNHHCVITDDGPGIAAKDVPRLFAVNRPLLSSKLQRLPTRGMLGHGLRVIMGAVAAYRGKITVASRGREFDLAVDTTSGATVIAGERAAPEVPGTRVTVSFDRGLIFSDEDFRRGQTTIEIAASSSGVVYSGPSLLTWYTAGDLHKLFVAAPKDASVAAVLAEVFNLKCHDARSARSLSEADVEAIMAPAAKPVIIGSIGEDALGGFYRKIEDTVLIEGAIIPVCVEAWVDCTHVDKGEDGFFRFSPIINRGIALAELTHFADSEGLRLYGCGIDIKMPGPKRADYDIDLSVMAPYVRLMGDGKTPFLGDFAEAIEKAVRGAAAEAYRSMIPPPASMSIKDAAYAVMKEAYLKASDNGQLPAKARQIMYAARGDILRLTGG